MFGRGRTPGYARNLHEALKTQVITSHAGNGIDVQLVQLQSGKDDVRFTVHVHVSSWTSAGVQMEDFLELAGMTESTCSFSPGNTCFAKVVPEGIEMAAFTEAISQAYNALRSAESELERCSILLDRPSASRRRGYPGARGDGHNAAKQERMKDAEDVNFEYVFTWIDGGTDKGWATHYRPKQLPLSAEVSAAFRYMSFKEFKDCPEFNFEPCYWRFILYNSDGRSEFTATQASPIRALTLMLNISHPPSSSSLRCTVFFSRMGCHF